MGGRLDIVLSFHFAEVEEQHLILIVVYHLGSRRMS
jgi:hypothetical protein